MNRTKYIPLGIYAQQKLYDAGSILTPFLFLTNSPTKRQQHHTIFIIWSLNKCTQSLCGPLHTVPITQAKSCTTAVVRINYVPNRRHDPSPTIYGKKVVFPTRREEARASCLSLMRVSGAKKSREGGLEEVEGEGHNRYYYSSSIIMTIDRDA